MGAMNIQEVADFVWDLGFVVAFVLAYFLLLVACGYEP